MFLFQPLCQKLQGSHKEESWRPERMLENGYFCGMNITKDEFFARQVLMCGDLVESQIYMPTSGTKGGQVKILNVWAIGFANSHIVSHEEIWAEMDVKGKNPIPVWQFCFDLDVDFPTSEGQTNYAQKTKKEKTCKKKQLDSAVKKGY